MDDELLKWLASFMAVNCIRNSEIENIHESGRLSESDMKAINKDVCGRLYSMLKCWSDDGGNDEILRTSLYASPASWDEPVLCAEFEEAFAKARAMTPEERTSIRHLLGR